MNEFKWFFFEDGYRVCTRGFSSLELKHEIKKHGKLLRKGAEINSAGETIHEIRASKGDTRTVQ